MTAATSAPPSFRNSVKYQEKAPAFQRGPESFRSYFQAGAMPGRTASALLGFRFRGGGLDRRDVLLDRLLDGVIDLLVDRGEVVVGALGGGDRGLHVVDHAFGAGGGVLERFFPGPDGRAVEFPGLPLPHALPIVVWLRDMFA